MELSQGVGPSIVGTERPPERGYFRAEERSLVPIGDAVLGRIRYTDWA